MTPDRITEAAVNPRCKVVTSVLYQIRQGLESRQKLPAGVRSSAAQQATAHTVIMHYHILSAKHTDKNSAH